MGWWRWLGGSGCGQWWVVTLSEECVLGLSYATVVQGLRLLPIHLKREFYSVTCEQALMSQFNQQETGVPDDYNVRELWYDKQTQFSFSLGKLGPLRKLRDTFFSRNVLITSFAQTTALDSGGHRNEQGQGVGLGSEPKNDAGWDALSSIMRWPFFCLEKEAAAPSRSDCSRKILTDILELSFLQMPCLPKYSDFHISGSVLCCHTLAISVSALYCTCSPWASR